MIYEVRSNQMWELKPNISMNWREAKLLILAVSIVSLTIGVGTFILGFPLILPFCGLEVFAFSLAFYIVQLKGKNRELVGIQGDFFILDKGTTQLKSCLKVNKHWVKILFEAPAKMNTTKLSARYGGKVVEFGSFLTDAEKREFAKLLINAMPQRVIN